MMKRSEDIKFVKENSEYIVLLHTRHYYTSFTDIIATLTGHG